MLIEVDILGMAVKIEALKPKDIGFLQDNNTLYSCDFRALGKCKHSASTAMWRYENILSWILHDKFVAVNECHESLKYFHKNRHVVIPRGDTPTTSLFQRMDAEKLIRFGIKAIWNAIPYSCADEVLRKHNFNINYCYNDFLARNDKMRQKELFGNLSPKWQMIRNAGTLEKIVKEKEKGFVKYRQGASGFMVFKIGEIQNNKNFSELFSKDPQGWYFEECAEGISSSVQCTRCNTTGEVTIFGFTEQIIDDGRYFVGSKILPLWSVSYEMFCQIVKGIESISPLLEGYEGFFGIDYMVSPSGKIQLLEVNTRLTAATIPTLITTMMGYGEAKYMEDVLESSVKNGDLVLTTLGNAESEYVDILRF